MTHLLRSILLTCLLANTCKAQDAAASNSRLFGELGGNGFGLSFNYERTLARINNKEFIARIGAAYFPLPDSAYALLPITASCLYKLSKASLETGLGIVPFYNKTAHFGYDLTAVLGYRRRFIKDKYFYRIAFTPFLTLSDKKYTFYPYVGFGVGINL